VGYEPCMKPLYFLIFCFFLSFCTKVAWAEGEVSPVWFWQNKGQWPQNINFKAEQQGSQVFFEKSGLTFLLYNEDHVDAIKHGFYHDDPKKLISDSIQAHAFQLQFVGANPKNISAKGVKSPDFKNYLMGNIAKDWISHVYGHESVVYASVYPGIDWVSSGKNGHIKSDWLVKPGANPSQISWKPVGLDSFRVEKNKLMYYTRFGAIEEGRPIAWQMTPKGKKWVDVAYKRKGKNIGFDLPKGYNPAYELVIDPQLIFFTYTGSQVDNWGTTSTFDNEGNTFTGGVVFGPGYPTTLGAFSIFYSGSQGNGAFSSFDCNIAKFSADGRRLLYSTYLGGSGADFPHSLIINKNNQLVVFGTTGSANFPVSIIAYKRNFSGGPSVYPLTEGSMLYQNGADIFLTILPSPGQPLMSSTYFGGTGTDGVQDYRTVLVRNYGDAFRGDAVVDKDNNIVIGTYSTSDLLFGGVPRWGESDGLVVKFRPDLASIIWARWVGGNGAEAIYDVEIDQNNAIYVCGGSRSSDIAITANAYRSRPFNPNASTQLDQIDGFLFKLDPANGTTLGATLIGTPFYDQAFLLGLDIDNSPVIFGQTRGVIPQTTGTYGYSGGGMFIQKFNPNLTGLEYSTTFGALQTPNISPTAFSLNNCGQIYLAGWGGPNISSNEPTYLPTNTQGLPTTSDAFRTVTDNNDLYFMVLTRNAELLRYGSFFGEFGGRGDHVDGGTSRFDPLGVVYHAICGCLLGSSTGPVGSPGSYSPNIRSGNCNNGSIKFDFGNLLARFTLDVTTNLCPPYNLRINNTSLNAAYYIWYFGNGDTLRTTTANVNYTYTLPGKYIIRLRAFNPLTCVNGAEAIDSIVIGNPFPFESDTTSLLFCKNDTIKVRFPELSSYSLSWSPVTYLRDPTAWDQVIKPFGSQFYTININNDTCTTRRYVKLSNEEVILRIDTSTVFEPCDNIYTVNFDNSRSVADQVWWFTSPTDSIQSKTYQQRLNQGIYQIRLKGLKGSCEDNLYFNLNLNRTRNPVLAKFEAKALYKNCTDIQLKINNLSENANSFLWNFGNGNSSFERDPEFVFTDTAQVKTIILQAFQGICRSEDTLVLIKKPLIVPNVVTADGNELNPCFEVKNLPKSTKLDVFNRWGKLVYSNKNYTNNWCPDGKQPGSYYFNFTFESGGYCNGWLEVLK